MGGFFMRKFKSLCRLLLLLHVAFLQGIEAILWQKVEIDLIALECVSYLEEDCTTLENLLED